MSAVQRFSGVSWRSPIARVVALPLIDLAERPVLRRAGLEHLPRFSIRARSSGVRGQWGGGLFAAGDSSLAHLRDLVDLQPTDDFLDVGSGAGRLAFALEPFLEHGRYTGMDVDLVQVRACRRSRALAAAGCRFVHVDAATEMYNPGGTSDAGAVEFPFDDDSFDVVALVSVFTHMLPKEVQHYAAEIVRVLRPGGLAFVTYYGKDDADKVPGAFRFEHEVTGRAWVEYPATPLKAVAYRHDDLDEWFGGAPRRRILGAWRDGLPSATLQDVAVYVKG